MGLPVDWTVYILICIIPVVKAIWNCSLGPYQKRKKLYHSIVVQVKTAKLTAGLSGRCALGMFSHVTSAVSLPHTSK